MAQPDPTAVSPGSAPVPVNGGPPVLAGCWNSIGVYGDRSCAELARYVHCRNCVAYAAAAGQLLNRELPAGYRRSWSEHFAKAAVTDHTSTISAVLFRLCGEWMGLPTYLFQEIAERRCIHTLPHCRQGLVLGLTNVRGELLICVSLGHVLGFESAPEREPLPTRYGRLLVVNCDGNRVAFPVEEVQGPHRFHPAQLEGPPATLSRTTDSFVRHIVYWQERAVGMLDAGALLAHLEGKFG